jgi:hypothetical protein
MTNFDGVNISAEAGIAKAKAKRNIPIKHLPKACIVIRVCIIENPASCLVRDRWVEIYGQITNGTSSF